MKGFIYFLLVVSFGLTVFNCAQINFEDPLGKDSITAVITALAGLCAILVLAILLTSKRIEETVKKKR